MSRHIAPWVVLGLVLTACTSKPEPAPANELASSPQPVDPPSPTPEPTEPSTEPSAEPPTEPTTEPPFESDTEAPTEPDAEEPPSAVVEAVEIATTPFAATPFAAEWTHAADPSEALALVLELDAGVLGRAGSSWYQVGADGTLVVAEMDVEPELPVLGVWPSDAWFVQKRMREYDESGEYLELRLMKLRNGNRWVPQAYGGKQWFHPGTAEWDEAHMSTRSGMLVYPDTLAQITRIAGKHGDPTLGAHHGRAVEFLEAGSGKIYVISREGVDFYAQIECDDDSCVASNAQKLPPGSWEFGRKAARGKHSVSVLATSSGREFILHHRGKSDGWVLDELPEGGKPQGMWASQEGGLWTLTGDALRWRDTESAWREVTLPAGLSGPSVALSEDRKQVWLSGVVDGAAKLFTTSANAG